MIQLLQGVIAASDTPQKLSATSLPCSRVIIQAQPGNSGSVFVGDDSVDSGDALGYELVTPPVNGTNIPLIIEGKGGNDIELSDIWIAGTQDDVVNVIAYVF